MADDNIDGISEERIAELVAEAEAGYDPADLIPRPIPPNIDGIRRCKVDLEDWNFHTVWDVADKRQLTFDAALNWIIAYGAGWLDQKDKT